MLRRNTPRSPRRGRLASIVPDAYLQGNEGIDQRPPPPLMPSSLRAVRALRQTDALPRVLEMTERTNALRKASKREVGPPPCALRNTAREAKRKVERLREASLIAKDKFGSD